MSAEMIRLIWTDDLNMNVCFKMVPEKLGSKQRMRIKIIETFQQDFGEPDILKKCLSDG
jgi:hypothetical protein